MAPKKPKAKLGDSSALKNALGAAGADLKKKKIPPPPKCFTAEEIQKFKEFFTNEDEEKNGMIPIGKIPYMLRLIGFNPTGQEIEDLIKLCLEDYKLRDSFELHEWYMMLEAKKIIGDPPEHDVMKAIEFLGCDNAKDEPTGVVLLESLKQELMSWGEPLTEVEFLDWPKVALKEKTYDMETGELQYIKFVEIMNEKDNKFSPEPVNYYKLDQPTLAKMALDKVQAEKEARLKRHQERLARAEAKRQRMIEQGFLVAAESSVVLEPEYTEGPDPFYLLANYL